ncbi:alpha/beta hydrolase [Microbacterium sp. ABRD28]|uniref:alpha/beta hydrolase n=1 Tax=Microbacterium sp. ABRD28 TaxID=2268461 RepID=UPI000F554B10|nr:alpha/beta hydrolase [Microbacterium sp. ABRD28]AZC14968.1 alpha/beta hydrolase [Microbacterium sp. ABRD28]
MTDHEIVDGRDRMLRELADRLDEVPDYRPGDVAAMRELMASSMTERPARDPEVHLVFADGGAERELRVHRPPTGASAGTVLHIHGGGFFMGSATLYDAVCAQLSERTGTVVCSIDYRLAPEHPYPAGLDDCAAAYRALVKDPRRFGLGPGPLGIYGESAGAALAAGVVARVGEEHPPDFLALLEPVLDDHLSTASARRFTATPIWNRGLAEWSWDIYLGDIRYSRPAEAAPAHLPDVSWFPPTLISTRDLDPLRDEGIAFARRLIGEGVPTELRHYPGTFHGVLGVAGSAVASRIVADAACFVRDHLVPRYADTGTR